MGAWLQHATALTALIFSLCSGKFVWDAMEWMTSSGTRFSRTTSGPSTSSVRVSVYMSFKSAGFVWSRIAAGKSLVSISANV